MIIVQYSSGEHLFGLGAHMTRARWQNGALYVTGKRVKQWRGRYWTYVIDDQGNEKRRYHWVTLGRVADMTKGAARFKLREIVKREVGAGDSRPDPEYPWDLFVSRKFLPLRTSRWRPATAASTNKIFENHIIPAFGRRPLNSIDKLACQQWLDSKAVNGGKSLVSKCHSYLRGVFREAVDMEYLLRSPAEKLALPRTRATVKRHLTIDEVQLLLSGCVNLRDRVIVKLSYLCALRSEEIFALRWDDIGEDSVRVDETVTQGGILELFGKTEQALAFVPIPPKLRQDLEAWKIMSLPPSERDFLFPGTKAGKPRNSGGYRAYVLSPLAKGLGLHGVTFTALRRTFATLASRYGSVKDLQAQMRHANFKTTMGVYAQTVPETQRAMVDQLEAELEPEESVQ